MTTRGRPPVLDAEKQAKVVALPTIGCNFRAAAEYVGCARSTIERKAERNPEFAEKLRQARTNTEIGFFKSVQRASQKEQYWRAAAWALERMMPERYAPRGPDVITVEQIGVLVAPQFADVIVAELPAKDRKKVLARLDMLTRALGGSLPRKLREQKEPRQAQRSATQRRPTTQEKQGRKAHHDPSAQARED